MCRSFWIQDPVDVCRSLLIYIGLFRCILDCFDVCLSLVFVSFDVCRSLLIFIGLF